ncbi:MAG TPA: GNAT family N-acetyltransferase [Aggregatilineales bacterium]|nr:GNAT family N-acetyltransferase [Aggregatilineales bacterium]
MFPRDFHIRAASLDDVAGIHSLIVAELRADYADPVLPSLEDTHARLQGPALDLKTDTWLVIAPNGDCAAYAEVANRLEQEPWLRLRAMPLVVVSPDYHGHGMGTYLLDLTEQWALSRMAAAPAEAQVTMWTRVSARNESARHVLEGAGYTLTRTFQTMQIDLSEAEDLQLELPDVPGIEIRAFRPGLDEQLAYEADEEAFVDEWGKTPRTFEVWARRLGMHDQFDASLWFLAWDEQAGEVAGAAFCEALPGHGWIHHVGVRRPWRRQGIGTALTLRCLSEFYRRGQYLVRLNVDADSLTGANILYEQLGLAPVEAYHFYEKEIRPAV